MGLEYLKRVLNTRVYEVATETSLQYASKLSATLGNHIWLKREDEQAVFSFKIRGSYNKLANIPEDIRKNGIVAASAGNHAQGVAFSAKKMGCKAIIFMPVTTPQIKIAGVKSHDGEVRLIGDTFDDASAAAQIFAAQNNMTYVPPFDDPDIIAGQATVGFEILKQHGAPLDAIFVPVGGGGLISGIAAYVKQIRPEIKIIGVEPEDSNAMQQSLAKGERIRLDRVGSFADGVAVKLVGEECFRLCKQYVDEVVVVDTDEMCAAIKDIFEQTRGMVEPAGALAVAGIKKYIKQHKVLDQSYIAINSGANINFDRLRHVSERAEIGEQREAIFSARIPEQPGSFRSFLTAIGNRQITEYNYRYAQANQAYVYVGVSIDNIDEINGLYSDLRENGYEVTDLTNNEMAKLHVRHMIGGHAPIQNEHVYQFLFPERPGALLDFLNAMADDWNISMFHYRNHGADYGRVLVGIQVDDADLEALDHFLKKLNYDYTEETDNPVYKMFLAAST